MLSAQSPSDPIKVQSFKCKRLFFYPLLSDLSWKRAGKTIFHLVSRAGVFKNWLKFNALLITALFLAAFSLKLQKSGKFLIHARADFMMLKWKFVDKKTLFRGWKILCFFFQHRKLINSFHFGLKFYFTSSRLRFKELSFTYKRLPLSHSPTSIKLPSINFYLRAMEKGNNYHSNVSQSYNQM